VQRLSPRHLLPTVAADKHVSAYDPSRAAPLAKNALPYSA
jgi:hypothetical protein